MLPTRGGQDLPRPGCRLAIPRREPRGPGGLGVHGNAAGMRPLAGQCGALQRARVGDHFTGRRGLRRGHSLLVQQRQLGQIPPRHGGGRAAATLRRHPAVCGEEGADALGWSASRSLLRLFPESAHAQCARGRHFLCRSGAGQGRYATRRLRRNCSSSKRVRARTSGARSSNLRPSPTRRTTAPRSTTQRQSSRSVAAASRRCLEAKSANRRI